ncbi:His Kinase A (phospho-acceptor) domain-containing protein [Halopseudomonas sabulinigri]|uniref:histidine kinase n=1 Tax=Halopseudomonas sabulinigri TaxID=472181 RepID=A0A1H1N0N7_9GAMM|nr:ATP-binding protein [Halopseudomonas sabulinigri]SDR92623.1 His Kinase A (phospho-acceptor) domain-containing protein [Halopseudomonas sabulinigri]
MNKANHQRLRNWLASLRQDPAFHTQILISTVFILLIAVFNWSLDRYWQHSLQPRLYKVAETQAKVLAESQSAVLLQTLERTAPNYLAQALADTVQEMLIVEDPAIGERFVRHLTLQIDYSTVDAEAGTLDISEGDANCTRCFHTDVPLINRQGEILGLASFAISDGYLRTLSKDMRSKLFAESSIVIALVIAVWVVMMVMFYRLHSAKKLIEASDHAKTRFMANVTHELRTPLNAILGYTQLYKQDAQLMQHHRQGIETIDRSADHLLLMISDILEFSRANEDSLTLHPEEIDLGKFLSTIVEMTRVSTRLKGLEFLYDFSEQLPAIIVADEKRLRQILLNLLSNAIKFTEHGKVIFSVKTIPCRSNHSRRLRFAVQDSGIGIDRGQIKSIFIPFHQLDNAITRAEGTGLGLTISQRLLNLMNSKLQVSSEAGSGSVFWFNLEVQASGSETLSRSTVVEEPTLLNLPDPAVLAQLKEHAKRHNVLALRQLIDTLKASEQHAQFLQQVQPFIQQYRFKQLLEWLDNQEKTARSQNDSVPG